ncbi:YugN family protein [Desertibacillus haloalkaliphilus]|uniref:YugN family protein n=1 Tax=Desertibacillus haloalkaliphilus TaxID=1328930 RepID=UPI001C272217|nr:YugN family protein [Desertibacillus haloalkaliphilus]MBU8907148.1 YugN-like family protein [Desertibacillus haloalkaliphilus]
MKFENIGISDQEMKLSKLQYAAESVGFVLAGQWDYERVSFDYKFEDQVENAVYYLRVQAYAIEGETPKSNAVVKLLDPVLGRHYYPHGVEYDEDFPSKIVSKATKKLETLKEQLEK